MRLCYFCDELNTNRTTFWFLSGNDVHIFGGGTIDGNGQVWYDTFNVTQVSVRAAMTNVSTTGG